MSTILKAARRSVKRIPWLGPLVYRSYLKLRFNEGEVFNIPCGLKMHRFMATYLPSYQEGTYEPGICAALKDNLRPGATFYDLGANAGYFSLVAASIVGPTGKVVAFEPHPQTASMLRRQFALNRLAGCEVIEAAASDRPGTTRFSDDMYSDMQFMEGTEIDDLQRAPGRFIDVRTTTIDLEAARTGPPDVMKVDVEGADMLVMNGARRVLREHSPVVIIELHSEKIRREYGDLTREVGYESLPLDDPDVGGRTEPHFVISRRPGAPGVGR